MLYIFSFGGCATNFAFIYFCSFKKFDFFNLFQPFTTDEYTFKLLVLMEHMIIALKLILDLIIP